MQLSEFVPYTTPTIKKYSSGIYVEYYCLSPVTHKLERHLQKANRVIKRAPTKRDGMQLLQAYCIELTNKLQNGWRPYQVANTSRTLTTLHNALDKFLAEKKKDLRKATYFTYSTIVNKLKAISTPDYLCMDVNRLFAVQFLESVTDVSPRTYNNHLKQCRLIFNWMLDKCYVEKNHFTDLKPKRTFEKKRTVVPKELRDKITEYLRQKDLGFLLYLHLIYNSLIRPKEILTIRIQDINLESKSIRIDGMAAKNHKERFAPMTPEIVNLLQQLKVFQHPANWYLFSTYLQPGLNPIGYSSIKRRWENLKVELSITGNIQIYSFRDSGIFDMLKSGIDDLTVMQAADHSSLKITTIYAKHTDTHLQEKLYNEAPKF